MMMSEETHLELRGCPADILLLIFEEVHRTAPASLYDLRLASRKFNILVHPIIYRHVKLNNALVRCFEVDNETVIPPEVVFVRKSVRTAMCTFTRQITINEALNWASVVNLLSSLKTLNHLHWSLWKKDRWFYGDPIKIPQSVLDGLAERWPSAQISVDNLESNSILDISSLPPARLMSLKMQGVVPRREERQVVPTLKNTLLASDELKVLHLLNMRSGFRFIDEDIGQSECLPALEELFLQGYFWLHSTSIATSYWNWTRLTSLRLEKVLIVNFLETVSPEYLLRLQSFFTDGHCQSAVEHTKVRALHVK